MITMSALTTLIAPNAKPACREAFAQAEPRLAEYGINTPLRLCHLTAQVLHETGGGVLLEENLSYSSADRILTVFGSGHSARITADEAPSLVRNPQALAERVYGLANPVLSKTLGNTEPGDGWRFHGRGLLQTTGRYNYRQASILTGIDFVADPDAILRTENLLLPALGLWREKKINDAADLDDIREVTKRINGGLNGLADRTDWLAKAKAAAQGGGTMTLAQGQRAVNKAGAAPPLVVDGKDGPNTRRAFREFQTQHGLPATGTLDPATQEALRPFLD